MSFSEPGKIFDKSPGDSFQGRPGDSFDGGAFKARAEAKNAESHARHERWKQEKTDKAAAEAHEAALSNMADMAKSNAEGFASLVGQFRAMMELCYPDLVKLCNQQVRMDSSELFPAVACISENGPEWRRPLPEGGETGEALVWDDELAAWVPGEAMAGAYDDDFAMSIVQDGNTTKLSVSGGKLNVDGTPYPVPAKDFSTIPSYVYLVVKDAESGDLPYTVTLESTIQDAKAYLEIGEISSSGNVYTISKHYTGGRGLCIGMGLPRGTADYQVPVWNNTAKRWEAGWVTAIDLNNQT